MSDEKKLERNVKVIADLTGSIGWVSFTKYQMEQIGIDPSEKTTKDLREVVFDKLEIQARPDPKPKEEPKDKEKDKKDKKAKK